VLASLVGFLGDFDRAEEAAQEAFAIAAERWPRQGTPDNPVGWLVTTGRNRAIDRLRRERVLAAKTRELAAEPTYPPVTAWSSGAAAIPAPLEPFTDMDLADFDQQPAIADERLELLFACCHPALADEAQVALTLRALGGLSTEEIARAFIVSPEAMKRRLTRAKAKIKVAGIPFAVPEPEVLPGRLTAVLAIVYLIFNEGYGGRVDLAAEAIRLGRVLADLMPDESEVHGLLALMLLHDSRRQARFSPSGELVRLSEQDRSLWDAAQIEHGRTALERALALRGRGPYVLQAAVASLQAEPQPDWPQIVSLYEELSRLTGSPVVELNRAVAVAEAGAPAAALAIVEELELDDYRYLHSTRAELLRRLGRADEAADAYRRALELAPAESERSFLRRRLAEL
jgi:RNA polymerase sigma-70 factor (ECF subfamily)